MGDYMYIQKAPTDENKALTIVSFIGCGISILALLIAITAIVYYR